MEDKQVRAIKRFSIVAIIYHSPHGSQSRTILFRYLAEYLQHILPFSLRHSKYVNPILNAYLKKLFLPAYGFYIGFLYSDTVFFQQVCNKNKLYSIQISETVHIMLEETTAHRMHTIADNIKEAGVM